MDDLAVRWRSLLSAFASDELISSSFADLVRRYREPARHYHTLEHIHSVLDRIDALWPDPPVALPLAGFLHDVIYDPQAADNEQRSADHGRDLLYSLEVPPFVQDETVRLILLTRLHDTPIDDSVGCVLLDADLAILAATEPDYDAYAAAIRLEYAWVSESDYRAGRRKVLERFLGRDRIFFTPTMHTHAEQRARDNLRREIARLGKS